MKILNLYAGIGGNRARWGGGHEVTSVEFDPEIAKVYQSLYPDDTLYVGDALAFLQELYSEYDFIWASPPCPSHGQYRHRVGVLAKGYAPIIPDMTSLYGTITFLSTYYDGLWVVENTIPYYRPLIEPTLILQRHVLWSNFGIPDAEFEPKGLRTKNKISDYEMGDVVAKTKIKDKRQVLRNMVDADLGAHILAAAEVARGEK